MDQKALAEAARVFPKAKHYLVNEPGNAELQARLDALLQRKLRERGDEFRPAADYTATWGYEVDANGTVPIKP